MLSLEYKIGSIYRSFTGMQRLTHILYDQESKTGQNEFQSNQS